MPPAFMGCTILGDGEIVPLVHAMGLLRWIDNRGSSLVRIRHFQVALLSLATQWLNHHMPRQLLLKKIS